MLVSKEFYGFYVTLPSPNETPPEIFDNGKFFPWFAGCLGAIDGSLLDAFVAAGCYNRNMFTIVYQGRLSLLTTTFYIYPFSTFQ